MKKLYIMGIFAGLAIVSAKAQEGCNGPVLVPGSTVDTCACHNIAPHCTGSTTVRNDYTTCGGMGFSYCYTITDTVGHSGMPCAETFNVGTLSALQTAYNDCLIDCEHGNVPCSSCHPPQYCDWNTCSAGTTGGTPITKSVLFDIGDFTGCAIAKLKESPCPSVVELALIIARGLGI